MKEIIIEDKQFITDLERLQDEVQSRQALLSYMIDSGVNMQSENFLKYQSDYQKYFKTYQEKKYELEIKFIYPIYKNPKNWNLDFKSGVLTIQ